MSNVIQKGYLHNDIYCKTKVDTTKKDANTKIEIKLKIEMEKK